MAELGFKRRSNFLDWLILVGLIGIIYGTLPFGPGIVNSVYSILGRDIFASTALIIAVLGAIGTLVYTTSALRIMTIGYIARIALVAGILGYIGWRITIPAERVHFIEYAILGLIIERVFRPYIQDVGRPFISMICAYFIGMGDETIQWLLPNRNGEIMDVLLNGWGGVLGILLVPWPQQNFTSRSHRLIFVMITIAIISTSLFTIGTRDFGHMIVDEGKGFRFRSRLSQKDLLDYDFKNGDYLGRILKQYISLPYPQFLEKYSANQYPFLHEMRVHIFRRDRYAANNRAKASWIASRENQILESYFGNTLLQAGLNWPEAKSRAIQERCADWRTSFYTSSVSKKVITAFPVSRFVLVCGVLLSLNGIVFLITRRWLRADSKNHF